jgi:hypothetical protein
MQEWFFYIHAGAMGTGFLLMVAGFGIARFQRQQRWWLKAHRIAGTAGLVAILTGLTAAFLMVNQGDGEHLEVPHTWVGLAVALSASITLVLGILQFKIREKATHLREMHRWSGRITITMALAAILSGLLTAGII